MIFERLFGRGKKKSEPPDIPFGRYSDNNKTVEKVSRWTEADNLFRQQQFHPSLDAFFDYLRDDTQQNVVWERNGSEGRFHFYQGTKVVRGEFNNDRLHAETSLAKMPQPHVPVMRRLLEMNFNLYYSRFALDGERLCMRFDTDLRTANPNKLYYGLKELAIKADKQDDILVQEFSSLQSMDQEHIIEIPQKEKELKFQYFQKWIKETLDYINNLESDKFSGGIAYMLLTLAFRIDYLIIPEGKLLVELEKVVDIYFRKDEKQTIERNRGMAEGFHKLLTKTKDEVFPYLFRSKHTFAIVAPQNHKAVAETINAATQNMFWYRDNNHPFIANKVLEYGISFSQYSYSLPQPVNELFKLFMQVNYSEYFMDLGFADNYYDPSTKNFKVDEIVDCIESIVRNWRTKYPRLEFRTGTLKYDSLVEFNQTFGNEVAMLNIDG